MWAITGNIVRTPTSSPAAAVRHGTRLFRPGAKVFLVRVGDTVLIQNPAATHRRDRIWVVAQTRHSRQWVACYVRAADTAGWRVQLVQTPGALAVLRREGWAGVWLRPGAFTPPADRAGWDAIDALAQAADAARLRSRD